jgi:hypothetical protein
LNNFYSTTFKYNLPGDPDSFLRLLNDIFRDILTTENIGYAESMQVETGSKGSGAINTSESQSNQQEEAKGGEITAPYFGVSYLFRLLNPNLSFV